MPEKISLVQNFAGCVVHGANPNMTRPNVQGIVLWIGTVVPVGMIANDVAINPDHSTAPIGEIDTAERATNFAVQPVGTTITHVEGLAIVVPPQTRSFEVSFDTVVNHVTGTAAAGSHQAVWAYLYDYTTGTDVLQGFASYSVVTVNTTSRSWAGNLRITRRYPPNAATRYFRIAARLGVAAIANWTASNFLAADAPEQGGAYQPSVLKAVTL